MWRLVMLMCVACLAVADQSISGGGIFMKIQGPPISQK
jgi:hypothetical protein